MDNQPDHTDLDAVAHRWLCGQAPGNELPYRRCLFGLGYG
jgi:hypothetical protein